MDVFENKSIVDENIDSPLRSVDEILRDVVFATKNKEVFDVAIESVSGIINMEFKYNGKSTTALFAVVFLEYNYPDRLYYIQQVLKHGADPNIGLFGSRISVVHFIEWDKDPHALAILELLIENGLDLNFRSGSGFNFLQTFAIGRNGQYLQTLDRKLCQKVFKIAIDSGCNVNNLDKQKKCILERMHDINQLDRIKLVQMVLSAGYNANRKWVSYRVEPIRIVPYYYPDSSIPLTNLFVKYGANANLNNPPIFSSLILYKEQRPVRNFKQLLHILVNAGADINMMSNNKTTFLYVVCMLDKKHNTDHLVKILLEYGADPNLPFFGHDVEYNPLVTNIIQDRFSCYMKEERNPLRLLKVLVNGGLSTTLKRQNRESIYKTVDKYDLDPLIHYISETFRYTTTAL